MRNVTNAMLRTAIFMFNDDFIVLIKKLFPNSHIDYDTRGMAIDYNGDYLNINDSKICKKLAEYFDVKNITGIHLGSCNIGVWIGYKD